VTVFEADRRIIADSRQLSARLAAGNATSRLCRSQQEWHELVKAFWLLVEAAHTVLAAHDTLDKESTDAGVITEEG
jgi:hypothetical protein